SYYSGKDINGVGWGVVGSRLFSSSSLLFPGVEASTGVGGMAKEGIKGREEEETKPAFASSTSYYSGKDINGVGWGVVGSRLFSSSSLLFPGVEASTGVGGMAKEGIKGREEEETKPAFASSTVL
ncbi:hypothetical protein CRG98_039234, partial [Punica granatum]